MRSELTPWGETLPNPGVADQTSSLLGQGQSTWTLEHIKNPSAVENHEEQEK